MPTYDYLCPNGHRFEVIHGVTADGPTSCPVCGESPVRKAFSAPSIVFKGSGWAKKDRSATSKPAGSSSKSSEGSSSSSGSSGSSSESGSSGSSSESGSTSDGGAGSKPATTTTSESSSSSGSGAAAD